MKQKRVIAVIIAVLVLSLLGGCDINQGKPANSGGNEGAGESVKEEYGVKINKDSVTFTDGRDQEVTLKKHPQRVVCLFTSYLEIWDKAGGKVIGRIEDASEKPVEGAKDAEVVGNLGAPSLEKIIALEPDLVILNANSKINMELVPALEQNNIGILAMNFFVKEDYFKIVRLFTALTDREDLYNEYSLKVKNDIERIINKAPKDKGYTALLMMASAKSITVRDSSTYVGQMLKDLNVENISDGSDLTTDAKVFSMETILERDPDFIFVQVTGRDQSKVFEKLKKDVESNPAWASLKAVKEGRYIFLPKELYMYKANHRYAEAYEGLAKMIYPEVFK
ncbi:ABC transporter substrate-binding protein [Lutispora sp.]|uniref:ABC transporter substrate-binding protein n=1 Tax=Lutispora sp. TaxID=2828727 RepID=UPI002B202113|nr:ABC transporter substrate-binding protein [Lutispora sp.]MEA4960061.1 ABC transporter substrate-binding protein [Lutispora sp.]